MSGCIHALVGGGQVDGWMGGWVHGWVGGWIQSQAGGADYNGTT